MDGPIRVGRRVVRAFQQRFGSVPRFALASGGAIVAVIGGDGSGKSTAIAELEDWLGSEFELRQIHLGKLPWSATTYGVRGALKLVKLAGNAVVRTGSRRGDVEYKPTHKEEAWLTCVARDRYLLYRRACRFANRGGLVISDRFPHPALQSMDVPLIASLGGSSDRLTEFLQRLERRYHDRIELPEVIAALKVDPETAAARKTDEPSDYVKRRVTEIWEIDWEAASVPVVDASKPKEQVAADLKSLIWDALS